MAIGNIAVNAGIAIAGLLSGHYGTKAYIHYYGEEEEEEEDEDEDDEEIVVRRLSSSRRSKSKARLTKAEKAAERTVRRKIKASVVEMGGDKDDVATVLEVYEDLKHDLPKGKSEKADALSIRRSKRKIKQMILDMGGEDEHVDEAVEMFDLLILDFLPENDNEVDEDEEDEEDEEVEAAVKTVRRATKHIKDGAKDRMAEIQKATNSAKRKLATEKRARTKDKKVIDALTKKVEDISAQHDALMKAIKDKTKADKAAAA